MKLGDAVASYRLHNQGVPNKITYNKNEDYTPNESLLKQLEEKGHVLDRTTKDCVTQAVARDDESEKLVAVSDPRKSAEASGW